MFKTLFDPTTVAAKIRQWLTLIGTVLLTVGAVLTTKPEWLSPTGIEQVIGLIMALVGAVLDIIAFIAAKKAAEKAEQLTFKKK